MNMWQVTAQEQASEGWSALFCTHMGCIQMQTPPHFFVEKRKLKRGVVRGQTLGFFPTSRTWRHRGQVWRLGGGCWRNWRRREGGEQRWNFASANYSLPRVQVLQLWRIRDLFILFFTPKRTNSNVLLVLRRLTVICPAQAAVAAESTNSGPRTSPEKLESKTPVAIWWYCRTLFSALCFLCCVMLARFIG